MRRVAAALVAALAVTGLTACSSESGPPTLTWYINPDDGGQAEIAQQCTQESGGAYRIATSLLPRDAASQREQLVRRLAANDSSIDIMSLDPPFIPEFAEAGFLAPVPDDVAGVVTQDVVESSIQGSTWKDQLVAVPFWANTQLLWYKKSVAEAAGLDVTQPVTWDQLIKAARDQDTTIGVQGARAESLTVWLNALVASAGGKIIENPEADADQVQMGLETDAGRKAAEIMRTIGAEGLGGPALSTQTEDIARANFESGAAAFMVNYPFVWPAANAAVEGGSLDQAVLDDYGWTLYPQVDAGTPSAPPYGGINLGIGKFSDHVDLAFDAARCIAEPEKQATYFVTNGNPPSNRAAYDDPRVAESFPMAPTIQESLEQAAPRPQTPYYNEVSQGIQRTWHPPASVDPDSTPKEATDLITAVLRKEALL